MIDAEVVELTPSWHEGHILKRAATTGARSRFATSRPGCGSLALRGRNNGSDGRRGYRSGRDGNESLLVQWYIRAIRGHSDRSAMAIRKPHGEGGPRT